MSVAYDLAGGVAGSLLYPYTIRFTGQEGGVMRIAQPGILVEPWNPVAGSNWIYDCHASACNHDRGVIADPYTGLFWPQRIEKADVVVTGRFTRRQDAGLAHPDHCSLDRGPGGCLGGLGCNDPDVHHRW